jgi:hypothetical protein
MFSALLQLKGLPDHCAEQLGSGDAVLSSEMVDPVGGGSIHVGTHADGFGRCDR